MIEVWLTFVNPMIESFALITEMGISTYDYVVTYKRAQPIKRFLSIFIFI